MQLRPEHTVRTKGRVEELSRADVALLISWSGAVFSLLSLDDGEGLGSDDLPAETCTFSNPDYFAHVFVGK